MALIQDGADRGGENVWKRCQDEVSKFEENLNALNSSKAAHIGGDEVLCGIEFHDKGLL